MVDNINFEQIKERILPYFIKIYGEEYKNIIIEKMQKIVPIFYSRLEDKQSIMYNKLNEKKTELTLKFLEHVHINIPEETKNKIINSNSTYYLSDIEEAKKILNACFERTEYSDVVYGGIHSVIQEETDIEYKKKQSIEVLKKFDISVEQEEYNNWIKTEEAQNIFKYINSLKEYIQELDLEYKKFSNQYQELKQAIDKAQQLKNELNEKYMLEFLQSIKEQLTFDEQKNLEEYLNSNRTKWYNFISKMPILNIIGNSLQNNGISESFSSNSNKKLNNPETSKFIKDTIKDNRIRYFKEIGIYNEQKQIDKFLKSDEAIKNTPNPKDVDQLIEKKKQFLDKSTKEYYMATSSYHENLKTINNLNLISNHEFNLETIINGTIMISPTVKKNENGIPELVTLLIFSPDKCLTEFKDVMFIHEINHCIETSLLSFNDEKPIFKCGYEIIDDYNEDNKRNYEQFSEIQNHLIAMDITKLMHEDNVFIFDDPKTSKINGAASYEKQKFFCLDLWGNYKKQIIESRVGTTLKPILNSVGQNVFETINSIINEYTQIPYYQMMNDLINNKKSELTDRRDNLIQKYIDTRYLFINTNNQEYAETANKTL